MRVFAWEYVTSGGGGGTSAPRSLTAEAAMMVRALATDLAAVPGVEVVVARGEGIALGPLLPAVELVGVDAAGDCWAAWRRIVARCDAVWPIAPETGGLLERMIELIASAGRIALASTSEAVALARSKRATAERLAAFGIPAAPTGTLDAPPDSAHGWVVKPDDGAGAIDTYHIADAAALARWRERGAPGAIVQPFIPGAPLSLSLVAQAGQARLLACNRQQVERMGDRFRFRGVVVGGAESRRAVLAPLVQRIAQAVPGLCGYVGVDLVDGPDGPVVLEVNPRLTTSYVGLAAALGRNPAALVLDLWRHGLDTRSNVESPRAVTVIVGDA